MPNRDGTGPWGTGRPGRGLGHCGRMEQDNTQYGRFFGRGFRFSGGLRMRGRRRWMDAPETKNQDIYPYTRQELEEQKKDLETQLAWLNNQLNSEKDE